MPMQLSLIYYTTIQINKQVYQIKPIFLINNIFMQIPTQCATYVFNKIGLAFATYALYQEEVIFSQILLGSLFIKGYRMMFKHPQYKICIYYKRNNFQTEYLYLKFVNEESESGKNDVISSIYQSIKIIDEMKKLHQTAYKVVIGFLSTKSFTQFTKSQFMQFSTRQDNNVQKTQWNNAISSKQGLLMTGKEQLTQLKDIVWTYINTFGSKYKNNYYCDLERRNPTSFNIQKLINTVNWIIYCQTVDKPFNQIQTANWTCFQKKAKEKLKPDRKDILLTGSAQSMMIHLLLLEKIENYTKQYEYEVSDVMNEFKKSYEGSEVKAYQISDTLQHHNLIYKVKAHSIQKF